MGNSTLRCFLACVLPCGALDLIRVVHINGHVDEYTRQVSAGEVLKANPDHVLNKACYQGGGVHRTIVVSPESDLRRGNIYFLVPKMQLSTEKETKKKGTSKKKNTMTGDVNLKEKEREKVSSTVGSSEKNTSHRRRRSSGGIWRPNLQSISED